jgi:hypothetical protein
MSSMNTVPTKRSVPVLIAAWLIVAIPAAWGISQTVRKSLALFTSGPAPVVAPATAAPAAGQGPRN